MPKLIIWTLFYKGYCYSLLFIEGSVVLLPCRVISLITNGVMMNLNSRYLYLSDVFSRYKQIWSWQNILMTTVNFKKSILLIYTKNRVKFAGNICLIRFEDNTSCVMTLRTNIAAVFHYICKPFIINNKHLFLVTFVFFSRQVPILILSV